MNTSGFDVFFLTMGAAMVLAMHAGFAFLEVGTVRKKNQVNALVPCITDFGFSPLPILYRIQRGLRDQLFAPFSD